VYCYFTMLSGPRSGKKYLLDPAKKNTIGRDVDCQIVLSDPLSSRVHAVVSHEQDAWWLRDEESRNGTFVNGQKADEVQLGEGCTVRIGTTELAFHLSKDPPPGTSRLAETSEAGAFREPKFDIRESGLAALSALQDAHQANDMLVLYQLSIKLLGAKDPDEVVRQSLELLHEWTRASIVGFLMLGDEGELRPKTFLPPEAADRVKLNGELTETGCRQRRAAWLADETTVTASASSLEQFADGLCVPLCNQLDVLGAIHVYRQEGRFSQTDFDFAISLANIMGVALARARSEARLTAENERLAAKNADFDELIGESKPMKDLKARITRVARASGCVLVRGESGSGKELVARAIHRGSPRADRPMLTVNCAAIPAELMESQLFGHKKGAFTSAESDHTGLFERADTGTLFLDEVGEMTLEGQAKLLRILEGHPFLPVGGTQEISADVRVIAATNRDLREFVQERMFREDLYYRLSVFELYIPPLRERGSDIELLLDFFLDHFKRQHGRPNLDLSAAARDRLLAYNWPGNVRQLRNVIDSAVVMAEGARIEPTDLGLRDAGSSEWESVRIDYWERKLIIEALARTSGSVVAASRLLGLGRATLYRKIEEYGIER